MTVFEITVGAGLVRMTDAERADNIERWLESFVLTTGIDIFAVDTDIAQLYARMFASPSLRNFVLPDERSKRPKSGADLVIAATAIAHRATVVTADTDDFLRIHAEFPLPSLFDPFAVQWSVRTADASQGV